MNSCKLYFKITNLEENHRGFQYNDGLNVLKEEFNNSSASCVAGGLYFTDIDHIFEFLEFGIYLREVTLPTNDPDFKIVKDDNNKWRTNKIILRKRRNLIDVSTFEYLINQGADIHTKNDYAVRWASKNGHLDVVQFLISKGAYIYAKNNYAVRLASENGHLKVVQLLISMGADIHAENDYAIRLASSKEHFKVVQFLILNGAYIHAENNFAARWASKNRDLRILDSINKATLLRQ